MSKNTLSKLKPNLEIGKHKFYSLDDIIRENMRSKKFRVAFKAEEARFKLLKQVKEVRKAKHITQKTVATRSAMPQSVIARMETGEHSVSLNTLLRIASAVGKELQLV